MSGAGGTDPSDPKIPLGSSAGLPPPPAPLWRLAPSPDPGVVRTLQEQLKLPAPLCGLLAIRGLDQPDRARAFLRPLLTELGDPTGLSDAVRASGRIARAIREGETILVHGDYDVDGIAGAALLTGWIRRLGGTAVAFVPHRVRDGYDLGKGGVEAGARSGASLLITVDSGIQAHGAVEAAGAAGMEVIVTDHHQPGATLPPAFAVVNPNRADCPYPEKGLCGTAVAFKLIQLLARDFGRKEEDLLPSLDLVALATIADLVPLTGENRILVRYGLRALAATRSVGLRALKEVAGITGPAVDAGEVGFGLAPRLNAAGRIGEADAALRLLLTEDPREARDLAARLDGENRSRREEDRRTTAEALDLLAGRFRPESDFGVVVEGRGWHPGIIGIVASRVVERLHRPVVVVSLDGDRGRGSARSIPGLHLTQALTGCSTHLERFGGHAQAAGMDLRADRLEAFREAFNREARGAFEGRLPVPSLRIDLEVGLDEITPELVRYLEYLGPFGMGNPRPSFLARGVEPDGAPRLIRDEHLKMPVRKGGRRLDAIGFGLGGRFPAGAIPSAPLELAFQLRISSFRGREGVEARIRDLRIPAPATPPLTSV